MSAMTKNLFQTSGNTILGVGSIYTIIRDELNILLSLVIALLTIIYLVYQTRKIIEDTKFKRLERKVFEEDHKKELHIPANRRHKSKPIPVENEQD